MREQGTRHQATVERGCASNSRMRRKHQVQVTKWEWRSRWEMARNKERDHRTANFPDPNTTHGIRAAPQVRPAETTPSPRIN